jgi:hypothetical protein
MKNRSLIFGVAMIMGLASIFSGCENPTDGSSGAVGNGRKVGAVRFQQQPVCRDA